MIIEKCQKLPKRLTKRVFSDLSTIEITPVTGSEKQLEHKLLLTIDLVRCGTFPTYQAAMEHAIQLINDIYLED